MAGPRRSLVALFAFAGCCTPGVCDYNLLTWNPHWECFVRDQHGCKHEAKAALSSMLADDDIDFANVIELRDDSYHPPEGWVLHAKDCNKDRTSLIYNHKRWRNSKTKGAGATGCMVDRDRPFIVQQFDEVGGSRKVIVIGAHFPHHKDRTALRHALSAVVHATKVTSIILLADTNEYNTVSSDTIMKELRAPGGGIVSTELRNTCCFNDGFQEKHTFDRIIANFGHELQTSVYYDELPDWARTGSFHKPVRGVLIEEEPGLALWAKLVIAGASILGCILFGTAVFCIYKRRLHQGIFKRYLWRQESLEGEMTSVSVNQS